GPRGPAWPGDPVPAFRCPSSRCPVYSVRLRASRYSPSGIGISRHSESRRGSVRRSLLDLHVNAVGTESELLALRCRHLLNPEAELVLTRGHAAAAHDRRAGGHAGMVAVEVVELVQAEDLAGCGDLADARVTDRESVHGDRIGLALVRERAAPPADP